MGWGRGEGGEGGRTEEQGRSEGGGERMRYKRLKIKFLKF